MHYDLYIAIPCTLRVIRAEYSTMLVAPASKIPHLYLVPLVCSLPKTVNVEFSPLATSVRGEVTDDALYCGGN